MRKVKEGIVVAGRSDKNTLSQVVDAVIIETSGFGIFNDEGKRRLIKKMAEAKGIIVFTDSDGAGFMIRNFIKGCVDTSLVKHAYIPDIYGKERRKAKASKEGKLGVEGMKPQLLLEALERAGATFDDAAEKRAGERITKADMFSRGLSGRPGSTELRAKLLRQLELPERMSADGLLDVLNATMDRDEFLSLQL